MSAFSRVIGPGPEAVQRALKITTSTTVRTAKLEHQMKRGLAGLFAEAKVAEAFAPSFEKVTTQKRVRDGATIIDMVLEGAKHPVALRGHRFVERGGTLPVEVEAGSERYFRAEIESGHLLRQLACHTEFGKGLVVTTRDVTQAFTGTGQARQVLRDAGALPLRLLPQKAEMDAMIKPLI